MIKILAEIRLYSTEEGGRSTPFFSNYRPLFRFANEMRFSGQITLLETDQMKPGEEQEVIIDFLPSELLREEIDVGKKFSFSEGFKTLGEGHIKGFIDEIASDKPTPLARI